MNVMGRQERRDFAMRDIIYDLLCVGKPTKVFAPEVSSVDHELKAHRYEYHNA